MSNSLIISALTFIIVFVSLLFSVFLFTVKTSKKTSNVLMACFLLFIAIDISVYVYSDLISLPPSLEMLRIRISSFKNPLLFLYILSLIYSDFKLRLIHLIHALPFIIGVIVLLPRFYMVETSEQLSFFENYSSMPEIKFIKGLGNTLAILYLLANIYYIRRYKRILFENYTTHKALSNYKWLSQLIVIILIVSALTFVKDLFKYTADLESINQMRIIMLLGGLTFICWLVLKALYAPKYFNGVDSSFQLVKNMLSKDAQTSATETSEDSNILIQIDEVRKYVSQHEPYLESSLTVQKLANQLSMHERELSILINHHLNQHFFDFINEYRIKKAMKILEEPSSKNLTILEILFDVGFNSKTPFNTAFKKYTNTTPTLYRQQFQK